MNLKYSNHSNFPLEKCIKNGISAGSPRADSEPAREESRSFCDERGNEESDWTYGNRAADVATQSVEY